MRQPPEKDSTTHYVLAMTFAIGALYLSAQSFLDFACWAVFLLVALIAWPIWRYQTETTLFQRRAILERVAHEDSFTRRWFWSGRIAIAYQVFIALGWAILLLALGLMLSREQWLVLAADGLLLALIAHWVNQRLSAEVQGEYLGMVARRWPLLIINIAVLTLAFFYIDFFIGVPNTSSKGWQVVAEQAFTEFNGKANCWWVGWLVGILSALDQLAWHASQTLIPSIPQQDLKLFWWLAVLLQAGFLSYAITHFQLGVLALVERRTLSLATFVGESTFSRTYVLTILIIALPYLYVSLQTSPPAHLPVTLPSIPCKPDPEAIASLKARLDATLNKSQVDTKRQASVRITNEVNAAFLSVERGVDHYLDWYFTVRGEYERLLAAIAGRSVEKVISDQIEKHLFSGAQLEERLQKASQAIAGNSAEKMSASASRLGTELKEVVKADECGFGRVDYSHIADLDRDKFRAMTASGSGTLVGTLMAKKSAAVLASKVAAKKGFQIIGGKIAAKKGGAILLSAGTATAICAPSGPFAIACGVVAGIGTWVTVDKAMIEIDELRLRDTMKNELLSGLQQQKEQLIAALETQHHSAIDKMTVSIHQSINHTFIPQRDGL